MNTAFLKKYKKHFIQLLITIIVVIVLSFFIYFKYIKAENDTSTAPSMSANVSVKTNTTKEEQMKNLKEEIRNIKQEIQQNDENLEETQQQQEQIDKNFQSEKNLKDPELDFLYQGQDLSNFKTFQLPDNDLSLTIKDNLIKIQTNYLIKKKEYEKAKHYYQKDNKQYEILQKQTLKLHYKYVLTVKELELLSLEIELLNGDEKAYKIKLVTQEKCKVNYLKELDKIAQEKTKEMLNEEICLEELTGSKHNCKIQEGYFSEAIKQLKELKDFVQKHHNNLSENEKITDFLQITNTVKENIEKVLNKNIIKNVTGNTQTVETE
ncbi:hypothetical protein [Rhus yellows phytoplasma]|uniref:Effector n=1 Tax=Rhus yellows phytoplasma TaxID=1225349 RepID=A0ABQ5PSQ3_9MOLU|nr:hypothetical protein RHYP_5040 [Rhus yellows phytoplasma]